jgi:hypothetical protein
MICLSKVTLRLEPLAGPSAGEFTSRGGRGGFEQCYNAQARWRPKAFWCALRVCATLTPLAVVARLPRSSRLRNEDQHEGDEASEAEPQRRKLPIDFDMNSHSFCENLEIYTLFDCNERKLAATGIGLPGRQLVRCPPRPESCRLRRPPLPDGS